jgi:5'-3' exonuclease
MAQTATKLNSYLVFLRLINILTHFQILEGLEMTQDQFVDLCILLGCDYCDKIKGIGPKNALKLIQVFMISLIFSYARTHATKQDSCQ